MSGKIVRNEDLIYFAGVLRWRKSGIPYVEAVPTPLYRYPIELGK